MPRMRELMPTFDFFADIHEKNSQPTDEYYGICQRYVRLAKQALAIGFSAYMAAYIVLYACGSFLMWQSNGKSQILHAYFPGIYADSILTIVLLTLFNSIVLVHGGLIILSPDLMFFFTFRNVSIIPAIVRHIIDELNVWLNVHRPSYADDMTFVKKRFLHYVGIHQKYNE